MSSVEAEQVRDSMAMLARADEDLKQISMLAESVMRNLATRMGVLEGQATTLRADVARLTADRADLIQIIVGILTGDLRTRGDQMADRLERLDNSTSPDAVREEVDGWHAAVQALFEGLTLYEDTLELEPDDEE